MSDLEDRIANHKPTQQECELHNELVKKHSLKNLVYFAKIISHNNKTLIKIGSTQDIKCRTRLMELKYGQDMKMFAVFDCSIPIHKFIEMKIHKDQNIECFKFKKFPFETSNEVFLMDDQVIEKTIIATKEIIEQIKWKHMETLMADCDPKNKMMEFVKDQNTFMSIEQIAKETATKQDLLSFEKKFAMTIKNQMMKMIHEEVTLQNAAKKQKDSEIEKQSETLERKIEDYQTEELKNSEIEKQSETLKRKIEDYETEELKNSEIEKCEKQSKASKRKIEDCETEKQFVTKKKKQAPRRKTNFDLRIHQYSEDGKVWMKTFQTKKAVKKEFNKCNPKVLKRSTETDFEYLGFRWIMFNNPKCPQNRDDKLCETKGHMSRKITEPIVMIKCLEDKGEITLLEIEQCFENQTVAAANFQRMQRSNISSAIASQKVFHGFIWQKWSQCDEQLKKTFKGEMVKSKKEHPNSKPFIRLTIGENDKIIERKYFESITQIIKTHGGTDRSFKKEFKNEYGLWKGYRWESAFKK